MSPLVAASNPTVTAIGALLVAIGLLLVVVTVRLWRAAAIDPEVLAPLEMMATRRFTRADDESRVRILDEVRHPGAVRIERLTVEPAPARVSRRHRRRIEQMEAEHDAHQLDAHVVRSDDSREIDLRASDRPTPEPLPWEDAPPGGIDPLLGGGRNRRERSAAPDRRQQDPSSWGEYE